MSKKTDNVNFKVEPELNAEFKAACKSQHLSVSDVFRFCMMAYVKLGEKAAGNPIHTLEFKGFEEKGDCLAPSFLQVAGRKASYGVETSKTKELAKR